MTKTSTVVLSAQAVTAGMAATSFPASGGNSVVGAIGLALQIVCVYAGTSTVGLLVELLTSPNNTDYDTEAYVAATVPMGTGTKTLNLAIPYAEDISYYRVRITGATGSAATVTINELEVTP